MEVRINEPTMLPSDSREAERFARDLALHLHPPLVERLGAVEWQHGDGGGTDWQAEAWLDDGTFLILGIPRCQRR